MKYERILLKLSGEALTEKNGHGINPEVVDNFCQEIKELLTTKVKLGIVIGGGNIHRHRMVAGCKFEIGRAASDNMGMLATVINSLALCDALNRNGIKTTVLSSIAMPVVCEQYTARSAERLMNEGQVIIFAGGTGNPFCTTDSAAALRACQIGADVIFKATTVDGVYDKDPNKFKDAVKYDTLSFATAVEKKLKVMDIAAFTMCDENDVDIVVFDNAVKGNMKRIALGEKIGTVVTNK